MRVILDRLWEVRLWFRRRVLLHRRVVAAFIAGIAVLLGLHALRPPAPETVGVWTARRDLPAGSVLRTGDLARVAFRPGSVPAGVIRAPRQVVGRALAAPLGAGQPVAVTQVVGPDLLAGYPGRVAVPVRITDPGVVALLTVGDRVDLVASDPQKDTAPTTLATGVPVVAVPRASATTSADALPGRLVVVAVDPTLAADVATIGARQILTAVWTR